LRVQSFAPRAFAHPTEHVAAARRLQERSIVSAVVSAGEEAVMPSSVIRRFKYDKTRHALVLTFVSGKVYLYADVPPDVFEDFSAAKSKGQFFNAHIRDQYDFAEVTEALS
jgi:lysyl-tRNA synthetase class 2